MDDRPIMHTAYRVSPQTQAITEHFYAWDFRLRGYDLYEYPVHPEPVFIPFYHASAPRAPIEDDARRHTLLSGLVEKVKQSFSPARSDPHTHITEEEVDYSPPLDVPEGERIEFQIAIKKDKEYQPGHIASFLQGLRGLRHPIVFELIGTYTHVLTQYSCMEVDRVLFEAQLKAFFTECVVTTQQHTLEHAWLGTQGEYASIVDIGLSEECGLQLNTFERAFSPDPFISLIAALEIENETECGVVQVIISPTKHNWGQELTKAITDYDGSCIFSDAPELKKATDDKVRSQLFAAVVRIGGIGETVSDARALVQRIGSALGQLDAPGGNRLIPLSKDYYPIEVHEDDLLLRLTHRPGMILSAPELVGLVHLPTTQVHSSKLLRDDARSKPCPCNVLGHELELGVNSHHGEERTVTLSEQQRMRHMYVIGASGTGKSTLLLNLISQDIEHGEGLALLDPHGDLVDEVLRRIPGNRTQDVILFDPGDSEYPIGFNILHAHSEAEKTLIASDLTTTFQRLSTSWGDRMHTILSNGIMAMLEHPDGGTLLTLRRFLSDKVFRQTYLTKISDPEVHYYWEREFPLHAGKPEASVLTRIDAFLRTKTIRNMVAQPKSSIDFSKVMNERKILLVKLSHGAIGEENAYLLGTLIVTAIHQAALRRQSVSSSERVPFYLYADEFQNFVTPSMEAILSGARKYNLGLVLAHQERRQLLSKDREVASSVLSNPYTRICFRLGHDDASALSKGLSYFDANDLQNLGVGQAIVRTEQAQNDFNLLVPWTELKEGIEDRSVEITENTRKHYATPRKVVEALVNRLYKENLTQEFGAKETKSPPKTQREEAPRRPSPTQPDAVNNEIRTPTTSKSTIKKPGRGGTQHSYLQNLIKKYAEEKGFKATIEEGVLGGKGFVDVSLSLGDTRIACEVSVGSPVDYEIGNIRKCIAAGYELIVICGHAPKLAKLQTLVNEKLEPILIDRIKFLEPDAFLNFLDKQSQSRKKKSFKNVRGYKIETNVNSGKYNDPNRSKQVAKLIAIAISRSTKK